MNIMAVVFLLTSYYVMIYISGLILGSLKVEKSPNFIRELLCVISATAFCFCHMMLFEASSVETYGLNLLISLILTLFLLKALNLNNSGRKNASKAFFLAGLFVLGLGLGNHSLLMMSLGLIYVSVYIVKSFEIKNYRTVALGILFLIIGLSVYLYLPVRAAAGPPINHGNPQNLSNLEWVITAKQFRDNTFSPRVFLQKFSINNFCKTAESTQKVIFEQTYYYWVLFALLGFFVVFKVNKVFSIYLLAGILLELAITYPPTFTTGIPLSERGVIGYYLVPVSFLYILSVPGLVSVYESVVKKSNLKIIMLCLIPALLLSIAVNLFFNYNKVQKNNNYTGNIFTGTVLESMDYGSVFLAGTDSGLYISNYLQTCENIRNDINVINRSMLHDEKGFEMLHELKPAIFEQTNIIKPISTYAQRIKFVRDLQKESEVYFETGSRFTLQTEDFYPGVLVMGVRSEGVIYGNPMPGIEKFVVKIRNDRISDVDSFKNIAIAFYNLGNYYLRSKNPLFALKMYHYSVEFNPDLRTAWTNIMFAHIARAQYRKAAFLGEKLLKVGKDRLIYYTYISALINLGEKAKAQEILSEALKEFGRDNLLEALKSELKEK